MADRPGRTAAEREAARREREQRRAREAGRPEPDGGAAVVPPGPAEPTPPAPLVEPAPSAEPELPVQPAESVPPVRPAEPVEPAAPVEPAKSAPSTPAPGASGPADVSAEPLTTARDDPARPMKSFPSPPDPEFYADDDELEEPSGTRRVARGSRPPRGRTRSRGRQRTGRSSPPRGRASRPRRWWPRILTLIVLLIAAAIVVFAIELLQPFTGSGHGSVTVRIPPHTSSKAVARTLKSDGVISSTLFFELRATLDGDRDHIRAGTYHLRKGMSNEAVLSRITKAPRAAKTSQVTIADGHTRPFIAALLARQHITRGYLAATVRSPLLDPRSYGAPRSTRSLEGFLFPDTFQLRDPVRASALVADQLRDFKTRFATLSLAQARRDHLSDWDVVIIASLIEAESASPADDRDVASVIVNRLRDHMMLQLDSTARYATGNFTGALTDRQLQSPSPYNTHTHFGLPPGPIDSPGLTALNAAAHPASSRYLYFFSKPCTDQTVFATGYAEFENLLVRDHRSHCPK